MSRRDKKGGRRSPVGCLTTLLLGMFFLTAAIAAVVILSGSSGLIGRGIALIARSDVPVLDRVERTFLDSYLAQRAEQLQGPAGTGSMPVVFVVTPGETADTIAANLAAAGLLLDPELFLNYVRFYGLDSGLEAGEFVLSPQMSIPEMAAALTQSVAQEVELRFLEGWRMEEMAQYLETTAPANIHAAEFLAIARREAAFDLSEFDFLMSLPADATLEGFLFPDTYRVALDATAADLVTFMLQNFGRRFTPAMRQSAGAHGLSLREAVTLASIVEREAVLPEERPLIAGVFYNRLAQGMKLEADPTVQYALGYQAASETWWKSPLDLADLSLESPYNTYVATGLPPGPIANPGLSALEAVAAPAESDFLFFVADCTAAVPGAHAFSRTYEEHLVYVQQCR
ncbi:MAG: endolytic transglycosylase MltG [Anaerolineae bacterium]